VCSSGVGFDPVLDGTRLRFGFEGIWQGTALLYDRDTRSLWMHTTGECVEGPRKGRRLRPLATGRHTRWKEWRATHPTTDVMRPDPRHAGDYFPRDASRAGDPFFSREFDATLRRRDPRLRLSDLVHGVVVGGRARAYPLARLAKTPGVVEETVGDVPVAVWWEPDGRTAVAYDRRFQGRTLTFERVESGRFRDRETRTWFDLEGLALSGPSRGRSLTRVPGLQSEWYGWFAHHPDTTIWEP
jgi:hypothetical protein